MAHFITYNKAINAKQTAHLIFKEIIRLYECTINYQQDDWNNLLPLAELSYNNSIHTSTKKAPFFANYGFNSPFRHAHTSKFNSSLSRGQGNAVAAN
ncbi:14489_t:CDS:2 [Dentiscutata erythropus]|uniref:14489_t:CDS:1 n=1 Tax=Dentiscutata erythropus TaxID=1348616 RepID=A0A9N8ZTE2_9GLOM|nr:14489_t:CDS:2 [Dentiscutata erythropus]